MFFEENYKFVIDSIYCLYEANRVISRTEQILTVKIKQFNAFLLINDLLIVFMK